MNCLHSESKGHRYIPISLVLTKNLCDSAFSSCYVPKSILSFIDLSPVLPSARFSSRKSLRVLTVDLVDGKFIECRENLHKQNNIFSLHLLHPSVSVADLCSIAEIFCALERSILQTGMERLQLSHTLVLCLIILLYIPETGSTCVYSFFLLALHRNVVF